MSYTISPYSLAFLGTGLITAIAVFAAWQRRAAPGGVALFLMTLAVLVWVVAGSIEASVVELTGKIFWSKILYVGAHLTPPFFLIFTFEYIGKRSWLTLRNRALLFLLPVLTILFAATNEYHNLVWTGFTPGPAGTNSYIYLHGIWFWVETVFINCLLLVGTLVLLRTALRSKEIYRHQNTWLILAALFPWVGFFLYALNINPFPGLDLTAISFAFTSAILVFISMRLQFLDMVPVARESLVENMTDGVLVLDEQDRIVDINLAAVHLFGLAAGNLIGQQAEDVLLDWPALTRQLSRAGDVEREITLQSQEIHNIDLRLSPLKSRGGKISRRLLVLRDITSRKQAEAALYQANRQLQEKLLEIEGLHERLRDQATRDSLTGLFNRRYLDETLERELARACREKTPLSVIMLDIDDFKVFNDTYGHKAGDDLLKALGGILQALTRAGDIACRYGGDEFVIVLPGASVENALQRAEQWRLSFAEIAITCKGREVHATFSAGVTAVSSQTTTTHEILRVVDMALYTAKTSGRNCVIAE
jgi:diguanylate cyclase (GGDEF)-like protein/PAS domain S-box-containing protein